MSKRQKREQEAGSNEQAPPLAQAYRVQERAARVGFDWPDARGPIEKVTEELRELEDELLEAGGETRDAFADEVGDLLFAVVNLARKLDIDPGAALAQATGKFERRFEQVKQLARARGLKIGKASLEQLDRLWDEVKASGP
ncbi:MAG TPA: MazG nucleotide pyrophosphohydrolase domain-containing protein [Gemmatimonadales bacterium]|nr:MazG nucleotide pyrophosphohydrolase domain-containing protein [Gemmatimonadales bacterium]